MQCVPSFSEIVRFRLSPPGPPEDSGRAPNELRAGRSQGAHKTVLVIDDEGPIADSIAEILDGQGFAATALYSGQDAVEYARRRCPDILLCDVLMPGLNGLETAVAVPQLCSKTRIVLISGQAATVDILRKARAEGHDFELLPKPIHPERLLKTIVGS